MSVNISKVMNSLSDYSNKSKGSVGKEVLGEAERSTEKGHCLVQTKIGFNNILCRVKVYLQVDILFERSNRACEEDTKVLRFPSGVVEEGPSAVNKASYPPTAKKNRLCLIVYSTAKPNQIWIPI